MAARNILFIMYDQLRADYLGCAGHPHLKTPNFDRLAAGGVRFTNAYVQSPVCGASRMSFYTGRYVSSHGASWNNVPLRVGEMTLGDHLRPLGMETWLIGKTHMKPDAAGLARLGIDVDSVIGARQAECGFDVWVRDDGLWAEGPSGPYDQRRSPYNEYLREKGYDGANPWHDHANAGVEEGEIASGWLTMNAGRPANIREEDSETPWLTSRAIDFLDQSEGRFCAHLSYIKPHWPYIVPAPWHAAYGADHVLPAHRRPEELDDPNPVYAAFAGNAFARLYARDDVRETVIPTYMGLIAQCDAELGRLLDYLAATGRDRDTLIVLTSDHGDYLGDHWLGEKDFFHDAAVKVPLIVMDPSADADATRGTTCDALVEGIDLAATFIEVAGGTVPDHIVEGRSLLPWLRGETPDWRDVAISEYDYSMQEMRETLGVSPRDARLFMIRDARWKMIHAEGGFPPMLFDLETDPGEFTDLGRDPAHADTRARLYARLGDWARRMSQRVTISDAEIAARTDTAGQVGVLHWLWDGSEVPEEQLAAYRGRTDQDFTEGT